MSHSVVLCCVILIAPASCDPLSYSACSRFAVEFERLYQSRNTSAFLLENPMLKISIDIPLGDDYTLKGIFEKVQFPIRYNFPQDPSTGVVKRGFGGVTTVGEQYFYLANPSSGKVLGVRGHDCWEATSFVDVQDRAPEVEQFQQFTLRDDGQLEIWGCPGQYLSNRYDTCTNGNELVLKPAGSADSWTFYEHGRIVTKQCNSFIFLPFVWLVCFCCYYLNNLSSFLQNQVVNGRETLQCQWPKTTPSPKTITLRPFQ